MHIEYLNLHIDKIKLDDELMMIVVMIKKKKMSMEHTNIGLYNFRKIKNHKYTIPRNIFN